MALTAFVRSVTQITMKVSARLTADMCINCKEESELENSKTSSTVAQNRWARH